MVKKLSGIMITKNKKILSLAVENFSLEELIEIKSRLVGTGFIGGKSAGMLLARKIMSKKMPDWQKLSEPHDSFYIGSDIFYSYVVHNRWWKLHMQQKTEEGYFPVAKILKEKMLYGVFSEEIMEHFQQIIEYFGTYDGVALLIHHHLAIVAHIFAAFILDHAGVPVGQAYLPPGCFGCFSLLHLGQKGVYLRLLSWSKLYLV